MYGIVYAKAAECFQSAKENLVLYLVFRPNSVCYIPNERKQIFNQIVHILFLSRGYTLRDMMELIYCKVTFLHTVHYNILNLIADGTISCK